MEPEEILAAIDKLELSEKILLVEDIWDRIAKANSTLPMSEWQKAKLDKRYSDYQQSKHELKDWQTVHQSIRSEIK